MPCQPSPNSLLPNPQSPTSPRTIYLFPPSSAFFLPKIRLNPIHLPLQLPPQIRILLRLLVQLRIPLTQLHNLPLVVLLTRVIHLPHLLLYPPLTQLRRKLQLLQKLILIIQVTLQSHNHRLMNHLKVRVPLLRIPQLQCQQLDLLGQHR